MGVGYQDLPGQFFPAFYPPGLGPAQKYPLFAAEAVDNGGGFAIEADLVGLQCNRQTTKVTDIFSQRELAVDVAIGERLIGVVLGNQLLGALFKLFAVLVLPPVV